MKKTFFLQDLPRPLLGDHPPLRGGCPGQAGAARAQGVAGGGRTAGEDLNPDSSTYFLVTSLQFFCRNWTFAACQKEAGNLVGKIGQPCLDLRLGIGWAPIVR